MHAADGATIATHGIVYMKIEIEWVMMTVVSPYAPQVVWKRKARSGHIWLKWQIAYQTNKWNEWYVLSRQTKKA